MTCVSFEEKIYNRNLNASGVVAGTLRMRGEELCEASAIKLCAAAVATQIILTLHFRGIGKNSHNGSQRECHIKYTTYTRCRILGD